MLKRTPLFEAHQMLGAKMVPFAGWEMPLQYTTLIEEHLAVRQDAGAFDISHMRVFDLSGNNTQIFFRRLLANDVAKLTENGQALYSCLLNERGGILDDLIAYRQTNQAYRLIVNAATADKDLAWILHQAMSEDVYIQDRSDLALLAVQGPQAINKLTSLLPESCNIHSLKPFTFLSAQHWMIARTGYTGEAGVEIMLPNTEIKAFWEKILSAGIKPIGLGARDTLRLEAGLNLYGQDMDETVTPFESNLSWTVDFKDTHRDFIGKEALIKQKENGISRNMVGVVLKEKGVLRSHMKIYEDVKGLKEIGELTSGTFSPSLNQGIGFARIKNTPLKQAWVDMRGKKMEVKIIKPPFIKQGKANFE